MNIAFEGNPYLGSGNKVFSDGSFKVAKMNVETKVPNLVANWEKELAKMSTVVSQVGSPNYGNDLILGRLGIESLDYYARIKRENAKKLKVNPIVANKSKAVYGIKEAIKLDEPVMNNIVNDSTLTRSDVHKEDVVDTRMSRLERTGEIPTVDVNRETTMKRETPSISSNIINTPTRFERSNESTPFEALINDNNLRTASIYVNSPSLFGISNFALLSKKILIISKFLFFNAKCKGVFPSLFLLLISAPFSIKYLTNSI